MNVYHSQTFVLISNRLILIGSFVHKTLLVSDILKYHQDCYNAWKQTRINKNDNNEISFNFVVVICDAPATIARSDVVTNGNLFGAQAMFTCMLPYRFLDGSTSKNASCIINGTWAGLTDTCESKLFAFSKWGMGKIELTCLLLPPAI